MLILNMDEIARLHAQSLEIERMKDALRQKNELAKLYEAAKEVEKLERDFKSCQVAPRLKVAPGIVVENGAYMYSSEYVRKSEIAASLWHGSIFANSAASANIPKELRDAVLGKCVMSEIATAPDSRAQAVIAASSLYGPQSALTAASVFNSQSAIAAAFAKNAESISFVAGATRKIQEQKAAQEHGINMMLASRDFISDGARMMREQKAAQEHSMNIMLASCDFISDGARMMQEQKAKQESDMSATCALFDATSYGSQSTLDAIYGRIPQSTLDEILGDGGKASVAAMSRSLSRELRDILPGYSSQAALAAVSGSLSTEMRDAISGSLSQAALSAICGSSYAELTATSVNISKEITDAIFMSGAQAAFAASIIGDIAQQDWFINWKSRSEVLAFDLLEAHKDDNAEEVDRIFSGEHFGVDVMRAALDLALMEDKERHEAYEAEIETIKSKLAAAIKKLEAVYSGASKRVDAEDKVVFIKWVQYNKIITSNISILLKEYKDTWPLSRNYENATLKRWYKEAMPNVTLAPGRPAKKA